MSFITAEILVIFFSAVSLIVVILVAWQFSKIKEIIVGFRAGQSIRDQADHEAITELSRVKADNLLMKEVDNLKASLKSKTIELAKLARENDAKAEVLEAIKKMIVQLQKNPNSIPRLSKEITNKINTVNKQTENSFGIQIDELNKRLYASLKQDFPDLTTNDLRLCAYIKIGMSAKEIANLLNIKPSSVYISRSRLRKKLDLSSSDDLQGFLTRK